MARATGSYPVGRKFKSHCRYHFRPVGQAVKTPPFHGGNTSSILVRVTKKTATSYDVAVFLLLFSTRIELRGGCGVKKTVWYTVFSQQEPSAPSEARQYARRSRSRRRNRTGHQKQSSQQTWLIFLFWSKQGRIELYEFVAQESNRRVLRQLGRSLARL